jgi:hypothetical protein
MKKDIHIPEVTGLDVAVVFEYNDIYKCDDWNVYIINKKDVAIDMVVIVSKGFDGSLETSVMRKRIDSLPANSFAKVELIQPELFQLNNQFQVTFFEGNQLYDKTFTFAKNSIKEGNLRMISSLNKRGILAK